MINILRRIRDFIEMHSIISIIIGVLLIDILFISILSIGGELKDLFYYPEEEFALMEETTKEIIDSSKNIKTIDYNEFEKRNYEVEVDYDSNSDYYNLKIENSKVSIEVEFSLVDNTYKIKRNSWSIIDSLFLFVVFPLAIVFILFIIFF